MKDRYRTEQMYAWVHFACANYARTQSTGQAGAEADSLLKEFNRRFVKAECPECQGTGSVSRAMAAGNATGRFTCDVCGGSGEKP